MITKAMNGATPANISPAEIRRLRAEKVLNELTPEAKQQIEATKNAQSEHFAAVSSMRDALRKTGDLRGPVLIGFVQRVLDAVSTGNVSGGGTGGSGGGTGEVYSQAFDFFVQLAFDNDEQVRSWLNSNMAEYERLVREAPRASPNAADGIGYLDEKNVLHLPRCYAFKDPLRPESARLRDPGEVCIAPQESVLMSGPVGDVKELQAGDVAIVYGMRARFGKYKEPAPLPPGETERAPERAYLNVGKVRVCSGVPSEMLYGQLVLQGRASDRLRPFHGTYIEVDRSQKELRRLPQHQRYGDEVFMLHLSTSERDHEYAAALGQPIVRVLPILDGNVQESDIYRRQEPNSSNFQMCCKQELLITQPSDHGGGEKEIITIAATLDIYHEAIQQAFHIYNPNFWLPLASSIVKQNDMYVVTRVDKKNTQNLSVAQEEVDFAVALSGSRILCDMGDMLQRYGLRISARGVVDLLFPNQPHRRDAKSTARRAALINITNNNNAPTVAVSGGKRSNADMRKPWVISVTEFGEELSRRADVRAAGIDSIETLLADASYKFYVLFRNPFSENADDLCNFLQRLSVEEADKLVEKASNHINTPLPEKIAGVWTVFQSVFNSSAVVFAVLDRYTVAAQDIESEPSSNKRIKLIEEDSSNAQQLDEDMKFAEENADSFQQTTTTTATSVQLEDEIE